ncbi:amino acid ABC transporter ATP-binding protein [Ructibacterium gallinarum]|uniref:Amino acid ABC transporter ATP-binding protein n=1 Tax=Ructibacterium gallinarum TaxID=2779355 RepID=A0A9D5RAH4_9FIRM|nr:amino acid ABC transporter ATP-binding protein [Ructibacterium gallinarum]MBE5039103.1 amino acid ABC transporter ATP-binding protein [Ructibacterium gallinarum]
MKILEIKNLYKSFGKTGVLHGVNFSMEEGEVVSIIGASGSGKTTLLRCINFLERADSGQVLLDGQVLFDAENQGRLTGKELRKKQLNFGLVFQDFNLFPQYNVLDNVMLAPRLLAKERPDFKANRKAIFSEIEETARGLLNRVGLGDKLTNYPCELSGGQKQRVSIARALALKPRILFFDEPTSALDPELTGEILKVIRKLAEEHITMVIVTHEIDFASNVSDKVIFMADGIVVEEGPPSQVIDHPQNERTRSFLQKLNEK